MTIDEFLDNLEEIFECKGEGYIKCLQKIKDLKGRENILFNEIFDLKDENEELKEEIEKQVCLDDLFWNVSESLKEYIDDYPTHKEGEIYDAIEKLKKENEKLKRQLDNANDICGSRGYKWNEKDEVYVYDRYIRIL